MKTLSKFISVPFGWFQCSKPSFPVATISILYNAINLMQNCIGEQIIWLFKISPNWAKTFEHAIDLN